jgi:hypothetical protein
VFSPAPAPAPTPAPAPEGGSGGLYGTLFVVLVGWAGLSILWFTGTLPFPQKIIEAVRPGHKAAGPQSIVADAQPSPASSPARNAATGAVYRTSVEQLYQDYDANEVAIQTKIADSPIRVSGTVAEIHDVTPGRPVVILHTGSDSRADMVLTEDQRSAAAQLAKEDLVEIQCNRMQRIESRLHGTDCALMLLDAGAKTVYLAVSLAGKSGDGPLYVVGPMSRATCAANSDSIAAQLIANPLNDRVRSRSCASSPRDSVALEGCRLNSTMAAIPEIPAAHLWKYDCTSPSADASVAKTAPAKAATARGTVRRAAAPAGAVALADVVSPASSFAQASSFAPSAPLAPVQIAPAATESGAPVDKALGPRALSGGGDASPAPLRDAPAIAATASGAAGVAGASSSDAAEGAAVKVGAGDLDLSQRPATPTDPEAPAPDAASAVSAAALSAPASSSAAPSTAATTPAVPDDLVPVRNTDPDAADRIVSYCSKVTAAASNPASVGERCRHDEMAAWNRYKVQNEFPTLDETARRKCSEPPFPDSFVARESCAKYQLHLD